MSRPRPRTLVVTPTFEEVGNVGPFAAALFAAEPEVEVLFVDDASPDGTGAALDAMAARDPRVHVLHRAGKLGLGTAYVEGFRWALARGFDVIAQMDADLSHAPAELGRFFDALAGGAELVVGSRRVPGGHIEGWGPGRHALSAGGSLYARAVLGGPVRDLTSGFKAWSRRALEALDLGAVRSNGYAFQIETTFRALQRGLRVVEVPITFVDRRAGASKMSRRIFAEAVVRVWALRLGPRG